VLRKSPNPRDMIRLVFVALALFLLRSIISNRSTAAARTCSPSWRPIGTAVMGNAYCVADGDSSSPAWRSLASSCYSAKLQMAIISRLRALAYRLRSLALLASVNSQSYLQDLIVGYAIRREREG